MASVFVRSGRRWYVRFKNRNGEWVTKRCSQPTRATALKIANAYEAHEEQVRLGLVHDEGAVLGPLMSEWADGLSNRSADIDRGRAEKHLLPYWRTRRVSEVTVASIGKWLEQMKAGRMVGGATQRHIFGLLSRFMAWAIERGHALRNHCQDVPVLRRPVAAKRRDLPWLRDGDMVDKIVKALPPPFDLMFLVGNRAGLRLGEICGLRIADAADVQAGVIRVRFSHEGPLAEDTRGLGRIKWAHCPVDLATRLRAYMRSLPSGSSEDLLFTDAAGVGVGRPMFDRHQIAHRWRVVRSDLGLPRTLGWDAATRRTFEARSLRSATPLDIVARNRGVHPRSLAWEQLHERPVRDEETNPYPRTELPA